MLKAVFFDLFGTLGEFEGKVSDVKICNLLQSHGSEIYPQTFRHAFSFVTFIDNPRNGFTSYRDMFQKTFERIGLAVDETTIYDASQLYADNPFKLYSGSSTAVRRIKRLGLKTAIVTTPPRFWFEQGIVPILSDIDYICTSSEAGCEKSNPQIYVKALTTLGVSALETVVIGDDSELDIRARDMRIGLPARIDFHCEKNPPFPYALSISIRLTSSTTEVSSIIPYLFLR